MGSRIDSSMVMNHQEVVETLKAQDKSISDLEKIVKILELMMKKQEEILISINVLYLTSTSAPTTTQTHKPAPTPLIPTPKPIPTPPTPHAQIIFPTSFAYTPTSSPNPASNITLLPPKPAPTTPKTILPRSNPKPKQTPTTAHIPMLKTPTSKVPNILKQEMKPLFANHELTRT
ncbi:hypothetical protein QVD17_39311 [Tagetes erecta]|uniref:Uncharacterized protein n=1 Tax=Tagetes erecta TaxID=13708 RepID=A0AAD8NF22_TARER|nr:hypothetical protein QVD17_39311 [Tagetes erecta]